MKIGVAMFFTDYSMTPQDLAVAAEQRGFDSVWSPEHSHIPLSRESAFPSGGELPKKYYDAMDPFVALMAAAAVTKTIKVGTGVCLVAQRDPIQTAKQVASIDQLSNGRFLFGIGNGWNKDEMRNHGTRFETRHKLARERVEHAGLGRGGGRARGRQRADRGGESKEWTGGGERLKYRHEPHRPPHRPFARSPGPRADRAPPC